MTSTSVDEYIAGLPPEVQTIVQNIREMIKQLAPLVEERISYGMPAYFMGKGYFSFAVWKNHIGFYPLTAAMAADPVLAKYKGTKSSIHIPLQQPVAYDVIQKLIAIRLRKIQKQK